jgi:demethylmenaquinone methyltransferase / 2-methoxy-6-polyprenyl-1,4-benzoquinol methylase
MTSVSDSDAIVGAPHAPLTDYYPNEMARAPFVRHLFDSTATDYDRIERIFGLGTGRWYRGQALQRAGLRPGMRVVDVGVGTGLVASEAARLCGDPRLVVGVDPSPGMTAHAKVPTGVTLAEGRAEAIPFPDGDFDFLSMGYALRHIGDLTLAFREFYRVLKPGGRLCLLEITCPQSGWARSLLKVYVKGIVPTFATVVGRQSETRLLWRYYWDTIEACAPPQRILATLEAAGFVDCRRHIAAKGLSIFSEYQAVKPR